MQRVFEHGQYIMGPEVRELEQALAEFVGVEHCVAVSSGTDALVLALMALEIGPGDEVITTPFSFVATAEAIVLLGATPVFVDIDPETFDMDPLRVESAINNSTKAILPVSIFGQCADIDALSEIAKRYEIPVIEDAAQSFGASLKGRRSCSLSTLACTSFFPSKPLGCYGDAGACFTSDRILAERIRVLRVHGQTEQYRYKHIGINGRMDTLQAAILLAKLEIFDEELDRRRSVGNRYIEQLSTRCPRLSLQKIRKGSASVFAQFVLLSDSRECFLAALKSESIPTAVHYRVPLHKQPAFLRKGVSYTDRFLENSERVADRIFSIPMDAYLSENEQDRVVSVLQSVSDQGF
jgi:UDP-2-acetamido-2-deoxy-ribo-hexuluronate aminotransferase